MPHVCAAISAMHFGALHEQNAIDLLAHSVMAQRLIKRRPASAAVVFGVRCEEGFAAANAVVRAGLLVVGVFPCESALSGFVSGDIECQWFSAFCFELGAPLVVCFGDFESGHSRLGSWFEEKNTFLNAEGAKLTQKTQKRNSQILYFFSATSAKFSRPLRSKNVFTP
jgi:hypothetical protein